MVQDYVDIRDGYVRPDKPFIVFRNNRPVSPIQVRNVLNKALKEAGLRPDMCGTHSFCIGRATDLMKMNISLDIIKDVGRWQSNSVYSYIKH